MIFPETSQDSRAFFVDAWEKHLNEEALSPLEQQLVTIIANHPEYHPLLEDPELNLVDGFGDGTNPFLHLSLHQVVLEQITTDKPSGVRDLYQKNITKTGDVHEAEHQIMQVIAETLWDILQNKKVFDDEAYLDQLRKLCA